MANKELIDYIKKEFTVNTPKGEIQKNLLGSGWSQEEINEAFAAVSGGGKKRPSLPVKKILMVIGLSILIIGLAVLAYYLLFYESASDRDTKRIEGIQTAQMALEAYFDENGEYPGLAEPLTCENAEVAVFPAIGADISDPNPEWNFIYGASNITEGGLKGTNAQSYILGVALEEMVSLPADDIGDDLGCECDNAYEGHPSGAPEGTTIYCVRPE